MKGMRGRSFLSVHDLSAQEITLLLKTAAALKKSRSRSRGGKGAKGRAGGRTTAAHLPLKGKSLGMIFEKPSTRTRVSFEVAMGELGGNPLYLSPTELQLGRGETIADTARVLSRYLHGICARVYKHDTLVELSRFASIPVINALSDLEHPCQTLADLLTILEERGKFKGVKVAYVGDGNNVAHSLLLGCSRVGADISLACPRGYWPEWDIVVMSTKEARKNKSKVEVGEDPEEAVRGADVIYTDVWASMGQESEKEERRLAFHDYKITREILGDARRDCIVLHCLPAHRGEEIEDEVLDGSSSRVWDQAENRLHTQKALLSMLL